MKVSYLFLLFLIFSSSSCSLYATHQDNQCTYYDTNSPASISIAFCGDMKEDHTPGPWLDATPELIELYDAVVGEYGMEEFSPYIDGLTIAIEPYDDGEFAGLWHSMDNKIELFIDPADGWHSSALSHEFMHVYENKVLHLSDYDWECVVKTERHFALKDLATAIHQEAELRTRETLEESQ